MTVITLQANRLVTWKKPSNGRRWGLFFVGSTGRSGAHIPDAIVTGDEQDVGRAIRKQSNCDAEPSGELILVHEQKTRMLARTPIVELPQLDVTGVYTIRDNNQVVGQFAVNFFDIEESTLTGLRPGSREPLVAADSEKYALNNPYSWLIVLGIVLIMLAALADWYVLRPRRAAGGGMS